MLGISTCWWEEKGARGDQIPLQALEMGFQGLELDYRITPRMLERLRPALKGSLPVWSVHNVFPCPTPSAAPGPARADPFLLSSTDREERAQAVRLAVRTVEQACDLEARVVVIHLGRVEMEDPTGRLQELFQRGLCWSQEGQELVSELRSVRSSRRQPNLDAVLFSLERIHREADRRGVILGIENRLHFHEIPDLWEIGFLLDTFAGGSLRYWHDVGHARIQEKLGILKQRELLERYASHMVGVHLHDVVNLEDHHPPGRGDVEFKEIASRLAPSLIRILEVRSSAPAEQLKEAMGLLEKAGLA
jgi:sugar phosphate isomerase/epimerase